MHNAHKHGYEILYDNTVEDVFLLIKRKREKTKFVPIPDGLYYHDTREKAVVMVNYVAENESWNSEQHYKHTL